MVQMGPNNGINRRLGTRYVFLDHGPRCLREAKESAGEETWSTWTGTRAVHFLFFLTNVYLRINNLRYDHQYHSTQSTTAAV